MMSVRKLWDLIGLGVVILVLWGLGKLVWG